MWWRSRRLRGSKPATEGELLVEDATAFLSGTYADHLRKAARAIPSWSWLNACAHGDLYRIEDVHRLASLALLTDVRDDPWRHAQRQLARELLEIVRDDQALLSKIQSRILVPLELELIDAEVAGELTAHALVSTFRAALRSGWS